MQAGAKKSRSKKPARQVEDAVPGRIYDKFFTRVLRQLLLDEAKYPWIYMRCPGAVRPGPDGGTFQWVVEEDSQLSTFGTELLAGVRASIEEEGCGQQGLELRFVVSQHCRTMLPYMHI